MREVEQDPAPLPRIKDPELLRIRHLRWRECALCGETGPIRSLHHIHRHPRDDVDANLVDTCGDGTTGCHGQIEAHDPKTMRQLREHIDGRADTIEYLDAKLNGLGKALAWLDRYVHP